MTAAFVREGNQRTNVEFDGELWRGGEGSIVAIRNHPHRVAKIIHRGAMHFPRTKIEAMIASPPEHLQHTVAGASLPVFAWPIALVEDKKGQANGFVMPRIDRNRAVTLEKYMTRISAAKALSEEDRSLGRRMQVCRNLAAAIAELHRQNHFIVDLKPANVLMFKDTSVVCLIDNDSFSIAAGDGSRFPATAYSTEYLAPELLKGALKPESVINDWQDRFALAILMFQILNNGIHPFQGTPTIQSEDWNNDFCVRNGYYSYGRVPSQAVKPLIASTHDCWDDKTRDLFDRTFTAARPSLRTSAAEWRDHFDGLILSTNTFARCDRHPNRVTHIRISGRDCPECRFDQLANATPASGNLLPPGQTSASALPSSSPLPPAQPGNKKWLLWLLGIIAALVAVAIANAAYDSYQQTTRGAQVPTQVSVLEAGTQSPPPAAAADAAAPEPTTPTPSDEEEASRMLAADDFDGIKSRVAILGKQVMQEAAATNGADIKSILQTASEGDDAATVEAVRNGMRHYDFTSRMANWQRFRNEARELNRATLASYKEDLQKAIQLQQIALALDPYDREVAGNLAIYAALSGEDSVALVATVYAMAIPRDEGKLIRIADWDMLAAVLARQSKDDMAKAAYMTALATTSNLAGFCQSLIEQQAQLGEKLKGPIDAVFARIQERGQSDTPGCAYPPEWKE